MERNIFMNKVSQIFAEIEVEQKDKNLIKQKYKDINGKNGIYFLYNKEQEIIYIGKVGYGKKTSFYKRMYEHGSGAHRNKSWFDECTGFKFKRFVNATIEDLAVIERLMIYKQGQPKYNDIGNINFEFSEIFDRIK